MELRKGLIMKDGIRMLCPEYYPIMSQGGHSYMTAVLSGFYGRVPAWNGGGLGWQSNQLSCLISLLDNRDNYVYGGIEFESREIEYMIRWLGDKLQNDDFCYGERAHPSRINAVLKRI